MISIGRIMNVSTPTITVASGYVLTGLERAIDSGDTRRVRSYAALIRDGGAELGIPGLVAAATELEASVDECCLATSLTSLDAIRRIIGTVQR
jgi:hypothetical protein